MRAIRENWAFILVLVIALILVFLLIGLQSAILSSQQNPENTQNKSLFYTMRQQLSMLIAPATDTPAPAPPTATPAPSTPTPLPPPPTSTPLPLPPTPTALPPTAPIVVATPVVAEPTAAVLVLPTNTPAPLPTNTSTLLPTVPPVAVVTNPPAGPQTVTQRADFRLGYLDRQDGCAFATEVVSLILQRNLNFSVETIPYSQVDELYLALASTDEAQRLDLTVCYADPLDRSYLEDHFGFVILVGSAYRQFDNKSFLILSNAAVKKVIQRELPCLYNFLTKLKIDNADFQNPDAEAWYEAHSEIARSWTTCE